MHVTGAMVTCDSLDKMSNIMYHLTIICNTAHAKDAAASLEILKAEVEREEVKTVVLQVSGLRSTKLSKMFRFMKI